jgi:threonine dehydrogenase-like Zn-dependent dehydrogenase
VKALAYHGPDQRLWDSVPDPTIREPSDIIVEVATTTIYDSDLHILKGDMPETTPGTVDGRLDPTTLVTHRFGLADAMQAYDVFADAAATDALKVVLAGNTVAAGQVEDTVAAVARDGGLARHRAHG